MAVAVVVVAVHSRTAVAAVVPDIAVAAVDPGFAVAAVIPGSAHLVSVVHFQIAPTFFFESI